MDLWHSICSTAIMALLPYCALVQLVLQSQGAPVDLFYLAHDLLELLYHLCQLVYLDHDLLELLYHLCQLVYLAHDLLQLVCELLLFVCLAYDLLGLLYHV